MSSTGSGKGRALKDVSKDDVKSEGRMPVDEEEHSQGGTSQRMLKEEARRVTKRAREPMDPRVQDELERAMEKEVFTQLHEENVRLKPEIEKLQQKTKQSGNSSGWSEVSIGNETGGSHGKEMREENARYTPNGARVPGGPPPEDMEEIWKKVPPWPLGDYEQVEMSAPCSNVFSG